MKSVKRAAATIAVLGVALMLASPAGAQDLIYLNDGTAEGTFTAQSGLMYMQLGSCSAGTCTLSGSATGPDGELGTYMFVMTLGSSFPDFGPLSDSILFPFASSNGTTTVFGYTDNDGDYSVSAPVTFSEMVDDFDLGTRVLFTTPLGLNLGAFQLFPPTCSGLPQGEPCTTGNVAATNGATISGSLTGLVPVAPEPASMLLMGSGLLGLAGLVRRKLLEAGSGQ